MPEANLDKRMDVLELKKLDDGSFLAVETQEILLTKAQLWQFKSTVIRESKALKAKLDILDTKLATVNKALGLPEGDSLIVSESGA